MTPSCSDYCGAKLGLTGPPPKPDNCFELEDVPIIGSLSTYVNNIGNGIITFDQQLIIDNTCCWYQGFTGNVLNTNSQNSLTITFTTNPKAVSFYILATITGYYTYNIEYICGKPISLNTYNKPCPNCNSSRIYIYNSNGISEITVTNVTYNDGFVIGSFAIAADPISGCCPESGIVYENVVEPPIPTKCEIK